jgi:uncharacterized protein YqeY
VSKLREDAGREVKARLRADLRDAMKVRNTSEVKVLRALIAAIDDAEAPPADAERKRSDQQSFASGAAEVERLLLGEGEVQRTLSAEVKERERAAEELELHGKKVQAEALRAEAVVARRYLQLNGGS